MMNTPKARIAASIIGVGSTLTMLTACGPGSPGSVEDVTLTVGTPNKVGPHRWLLASGEGKGTDYTLEYADFDSTSPLIEAMSAGDVDVASGGETGVLFALANGADITIAAANVQKGEGGYKVLVKEDSPLQDLGDLKGKRVALPFYSKQHYQLAIGLREAGVAWDDVDIVNLTTADGLSALNTGDVDAYVAWDPQAAIAELEHDSRVLFDLAKAKNDPGAVYINSENLDDGVRQGALGDLVGRLDRAQHWTNENAEDWASQVSELSGVSQEVADLQVSRADQEYVPVTDEIIADWQQQVDYFQEIGQIDEPIDVAEHVTHAYDDVLGETDAGD